MILFSNKVSNRLRYVAEFIGNELSGFAIPITADREIYASYQGPRINYSENSITEKEVWIKPQGLLEETGIRPQAIKVIHENGVPYFFKQDSDFPFDIFSATFFLLTRYEEYLLHEKDLYGRYDHTNSLAYREQFLRVPLVNQWINYLANFLEKRFPRAIQRKNRFSFIPTYDIDEAYCYRYKEWWRSAGGALRDLASGHWKLFAQRRKVLNGEEVDPYDSYSWLDDLHRPLSIKPRYFFLVAGKTGNYDKNILPSVTAMQTLIKDITGKYQVGIHPSWQSGDEVHLLKEEMMTLEKITGLKITSSRQHFIRMNLPQTYRNLIAAGIQEDHSMGYGSINGFRASVCSPFFWYDLEEEQQTTLLVHPFCFMEANSFFEQKYSATQALEELNHYHNVVRDVGGTMITIWHNTFLGTMKRFRGWRETYRNFILGMS